jgi:hypothetical protein
MTRRHILPERRLPCRQTQCRALHRRVERRQDMGAVGSPPCFDSTAIPGLRVLWAQGIERGTREQDPGVYTPKQRSEFSH